MVDKLAKIKDRWVEVQEQLSDPEVVGDQKRYMRLSKEYKDLGGIVELYDDYVNVIGNIESNKKILSTEKDEEFRDMAKADLDELAVRKTQLEDEIRLTLIPKDPEDEKNVMIEIRGGTGGDEASIFAGDLFRMYTRYFETKGWQFEMVTENFGTAGGYKEVVASVSGENVYGTLKYESGVHRVQRVPATESQGRVHTSAATVAVLPEAEEVDVDINPADLRTDTFRASGAGGQHVNKTESAVRITHIPTGIIVECQEGRSQLKNREIAMKALRTKMYEAKLEVHNAEIAARRKTLVSTGDRSAKIRTYNYSQGRCTDHRIGLTLYNLGAIMNGDLDEIIHALQVAENAEKLKEGGLD